MVFFTVIFTIASPGASSVHCIASESFPSEMRSQVMAIFFTVGFGSGGIVAPSIFGYLIQQESREYVAIGYFISAFLMFMGGIICLCFGIDSEKKSLE